LQKNLKELKMKIGFNPGSNSNGQNKKLQIPCDFRHKLILGRTGSGKTASVITPTLVDLIKKNMEF
jgi:type IV secretory pathway TraG/TraD family ATPase VirD4